jgi:hypothetical protein
VIVGYCSLLRPQGTSGAVTTGSSGLARLHDSEPAVKLLGIPYSGDGSKPDHHADRAWCRKIRHDAWPVSEHGGYPPY